MDMVYISVLVVILLFIFLDVYLRVKKAPKAKIRTFEGIFLMCLIISLIIITENLSILTVLGATILSMSWVFKELIANFGTSFLMYFYPPFEENDIIKLGDMDELTFQGPGFLRTALKKPNGDVVLVPNRTLFNEQLTVS